MSAVAISLLAFLERGPAYGLQLRNEFEAHTGGVWPLNVGQVYTTLERLERDGLVRLRPEVGAENQNVYEITRAGRRRVEEWFSEPMQQRAPARDELVLKLIMAAARNTPAVADVIQAERKASVELLQEYTRLKRDGRDGEIGWLFLVDSLIFQTEARIRWLDACEARLAREGLLAHGARPRARRPAPKLSTAEDRNEVKA